MSMAVPYPVPSSKSYQQFNIYSDLNNHQAGWTGTNCDIDKDECEAHGHKCLNGAQCVDLIADFRSEPASLSSDLSNINVLFYFF